MPKFHTAKVQSHGGSSSSVGGGATTLPDLTDVSDTIDTDAPDGGVMLWDDTAGSWKTTSLFQILAGVLTWSVDTNLYRSAANVLHTDDAFTSNQYIASSVAVSGDASFAATKIGDTENRFLVSGEGKISWSDGSAAVDLNLYRKSANLLRTDYNLDVGGYLNLTGALATTGKFYLAVTADTVNRLEIDADGTHLWGSGSLAADTTLYRSAADKLKTDDQFLMGTAPTNSPGTIAVAGSKGSGLDVAWADHTHAHEAAHINHDTTWAAKGDLVVATANDTATVLPVGVDTQVLSADSTTGTGVKWVAASAGSTVTAFTKDLGASYRSGTFDITGLSGLTADKSYDVRQSGAVVASKGNARDESEMDTIIVTAYALNTTDLRALWYSANGAVVVGTYAFVSVT